MPLVVQHETNDGEISNKSKRTCRYCKSTGMERIPRSFIMKTLFFWLPVRRFVCYKCLKKQYKII